MTAQQIKNLKVTHPGYWILSRNKQGVISYTPVKGTPVNLTDFPDLDLFAHHTVAPWSFGDSPEYQKGWTVSSGHSGHIIAYHSRLKSLAIAAARLRIETYSHGDILELIAKHPLTPRYLP